MIEKVSKIITNFLPVFDQLRHETAADFRSDLSAALTVTVMLVPQAMAYAMLAGLPPVMGLYASTVPVAVYALLGTSRQLAVGPVAMVSLLVFTGVSQLAEPGSDHYISLTLMLAVLVGVIQIVLGLFKVGFITNYVSHAVIAGFTSAAAIIISVSQLSHFTGFQIARGATVFHQLADGLVHYRGIHWMTLIIGVVTVGLLFLLNRFFPRIPGALAVVAISIPAAWFFKWEAAGVKLVHHVPVGLPTFVLPEFSSTALSTLLPIAVTIAFIGFMESYAIAQSIATREKRTVESDREFIALGMSDIAAGLFSGYPVTGGLSRTAVNYSAGARSNLAGLMTAGFLAITLTFFTPLFYYLPKAVLAAIIVHATTRLIDFRECLNLFRLKFGDGLTFLMTFAVTLLFGVEHGIVTGVVVSLLLFIRRSTHPHMAILGYCQSRNAYLNINRFPMTVCYPHVLIIRVDASLYFANTAFVKSTTKKWIEEQKDVRLVIFDFEGVNDMDAVAVSMLQGMLDDYDSRHVDFAFARLKGPVRDILTRAGWPRKYPHSIRFRSVGQVVEELKITVENGFQKEKQLNSSPLLVDKTEEL